MAALPIQRVLKAISTVTTGKLFTAITSSGSEQRFVFYKSDSFHDQGGIFWVAAEDDVHTATERNAVVIDVNLAVQRGKSAAGFNTEAAADFPDDQCFSIADLHLAAPSASVASDWIEAIEMLIKRRQEAIQKQNTDGGTIMFRKGRRLSITISQANRQKANMANDGPRNVFVSDSKGSASRRDSVKKASSTASRRRPSSPRSRPGSSRRRDSSVYNSFKAELLLELRSEIKSTIVQALGGANPASVPGADLIVDHKQKTNAPPSPHSDLLATDLSALSDAELRAHVLELRGVVRGQQRELQTAERHRAKRAEMIPRLLQKSFDLEASLDNARSKIQRFSNKVYSLEKALADSKKEHAKTKREILRARMQAQQHREQS